MDYFDCFREVWQPLYLNHVDQVKIQEAINDQYSWHSDDNLQFGNTIPAFRNRFMTSAYLYKYAYHHAQVMKSVFSEVLYGRRQPPSPHFQITSDFNGYYDYGKRPLFRRNELNICSLGGAAGISNVAIMEILCENEQFDFNNTAVNNTSIDLYGSWRSPFYTVMEYAKSDLQLHGEDKFIQHNLAQNWSNDVEEAIENADIICMNKFLSYVYRDHRYLNMMRKIFQFAKKHCLIILLDNNYDGMLIPDELQDEVENIGFQLRGYRDRFTSPMPNIDFNVVNYFGHNPLLHTNQDVMIWVKF